MSVGLPHENFRNTAVSTFHTLTTKVFGQQLLIRKLSSPECEELVWFAPPGHHNCRPLQNELLARIPRSPNGKTTTTTPTTRTMLFALSSPQSLHYFFSVPLFFQSLDIFQPVLQEALQNIFDNRKREESFSLQVFRNYYQFENRRDVQATRYCIVISVLVLVILLDVLIGLEEAKKDFPGSTLTYRSTFADVVARPQMSLTPCHHKPVTTASLHDDSCDDSLNEEEEEEALKNLTEMGYFD